MHFLMRVLAEVEAELIEELLHAAVQPTHAPLGAAPQLASSSALLTGYSAGMRASTNLGEA
jgi:hypothetical protein